MWRTDLSSIWHARGELRSVYEVGGCVIRLEVHRGVLVEIGVSGLRWQWNKHLYIFNHKVYWRYRYIFKFWMSQVDLSMSSISGTTHIQTIFSMWPVSGRHFTCNAFCSSNDSDTQLTFFTFSTVDDVFSKLREDRIQMSEVWWTRGPENGSPLSYPPMRKFPVQKGTNTTGKMWRCTV